MKKRWAFLMSGTIFFIIAFIFAVGHTITHESVHESIYTNYDIKSEINYEFFGLAGSTKADRDEFLEKCNDKCRELQVNNEIVSYNMSYLISTIFAAVGILMFYDFLKDDGTKQGDDYSCWA